MSRMYSLPQGSILFAPMAGVSDMPFRVLCREAGAAMVCTEMVSAKGLWYNSEKTEFLMSASRDEHPLGIQFFGRESEIMGEAAKRAAASGVFDFIDINMGCPVPKVVNNGEGSALMREPVLAGRIISAVVKAAEGLPVTVKMRRGFTNAEPNAPELAKIAEESGAAAVCVHGRTRDQYYTGEADWGIIRAVKQSVGIPVIGNGDVNSPEAAKRMFRETGADAVMVGRAAQGNPWIFTQIRDYLEAGKFSLPSPQERLELIKRHFAMMLDHKGEHTTVLEMRKHVCWYIKGLPGSAEARVRVNAAETTAKQIRIVTTLLDNR